MELHYLKHEMVEIVRNESQIQIFLPSPYGFSGSVPSEASGMMTAAPAMFRPILEVLSNLIKEIHHQTVDLLMVHLLQIVISITLVQ